MAPCWRQLTAKNRPGAIKLPRIRRSPHSPTRGWHGRHSGAIPSPLPFCGNQGRESKRIRAGCHGESCQKHRRRSVRAYRQAWREAGNRLRILKCRVSISGFSMEGSISVHGFHQVIISNQQGAKSERCCKPPPPSDPAYMISAKVSMTKFFCLGAIWVVRIGVKDAGDYVSLALLTVFCS